MALSTYAELKATMTRWLVRSDLTADIPDFIALFEGRARRELREWLHTTISATNLTTNYVVAATVDIVLGVAYNDGAGGVRNGPLDLIGFEDYHARMACDATVRQPVQAVFVDRDEVANTTTLRFYPPVSVSAPLSAIALDVIGYLPALSDSATTNRLLAVAPDAYLYGALLESAPFLQHDERIPIWQSRCDEALQGLTMHTERKLQSGNRPMRFERVFG